MGRFFKFIPIILIFFSGLLTAEDVFLTAGFSQSFHTERYVYYYEGWLVTTDSISFSFSEKKGDMLRNCSDGGYYSESNIVIKNYSETSIGSHYVKQSINQFLLRTRVSFTDLLAFENLIGKDFPRGNCMYNFMFRYIPTFRFTKMTVTIGGGIAVTDIYGEFFKLSSYLLDMKNTEDNNKFFVKTATLEGTEIILAEKIEGTFWGARFTSPTDLITLFKYSGFSEYMDMYLYVENGGFKISFGGNVFSWAFSGRTGSIFVRTEAGFMIKENLYLNAAVAGELNKEKVMFAEARAALSWRFTIPLVD